MRSLLPYRTFFLLLRPLRSQTATTRIWYAFYPFKQSGLHTRRLGESLMLSQTLLSVHRSVLTLRRIVRILYKAVFWNAQ